MTSLDTESGIRGAIATDDASASALDHVSAFVPGIADAAKLSEADSLSRRFAPVFDRIAKTAIHREKNRELAYEEVKWLRDAGFTRLRVPKRYGGDGIDLHHYFSLLTQLGEADSNLPQILRVHSGFIETLLEGNDEALRDLWFQRIVQGTIIGGAVAEKTGVTNNSVRVSPHAEGWQLDGEKFYTTGSLYADWIDVAANDGATDVRILVRSDTPGVQRVDDWDGFGQRLTGSGTVRFDAVVVPHEGLYRRFNASEPRRDSALTAFYQTVHLANLAGITRAILRDAVEFTQPRTRTFGVAGASRPTDNPLVQRVVGRLASLAYSTQSISGNIARALDEAASAREAGRADTDTYVRLEIQAFQAQQIILEQTQEAATLLFEVGGASATSEARRLDRHWRNTRVLSSHNPAILREAAIGRFYLTGEGQNERFGVGLAVTRDVTRDGAASGTVSANAEQVNHAYAD